MNRRALLQLAWLTGCSRTLDVASSNPFAAWLALGSDFEEQAYSEAEWAARELERLGGLVREDLARDGDLAASARRVVFERGGFVREVDDPSLRFVLLPSVLRTKRGSCVGLGTLLAALAQLAGGDAHGVLRPGHFYVRLQHRARVCNVDPLREGEQMPDAWYDARFPLPAQVDYYARPLSRDEVLGVFEYNIGNERKRQQRWSDARRAYSRAVGHFPSFAEAHASLGTVLHVQGELGAAEHAYRRALRQNPLLPGLEWNLELLLAERARTTTHVTVRH